MRCIVAQVFRIKVPEPEPDPVKRIGIFENRIQQPDAVNVRQRKGLQISASDSIIEAMILDEKSSTGIFGFAVSSINIAGCLAMAIVNVIVRTADVVVNDSIHQHLRFFFGKHNAIHLNEKQRVE